MIGKLIAVDCQINNSYSLRLIVAYIPNPADTDYIKLLLNTISALISNTKCYVILGDFNLPNINWSTLEHKNTKSYDMLKSFVLSNYPISQLIDFPTRHQNTIDL